MKRIMTFWVLVITATCMLLTCSKAQIPTPEKGEIVNNKNVPIVYLSRTGNTEAIAEMIHEEVGGTLVELELETPYKITMP